MEGSAKKSRMIRAALLVAMAAGLAACGGEATLDASSPAKLEASLARYVGGASRANRTSRKQAVEIIKSIYLKGDKFAAQLPTDVPPVEILNRLKFSEVYRTAMKVKGWAEHGMHATAHPNLPETDIERRWRNQFLIDQLAAQEQILEAKRDRAQYEDLFTVDQFNYTDTAFIPPQPGVPAGQDKAVFTTKFENTAGFNVYEVGFHITVKDPALRDPLVDDDFTYKAEKDPIQVGETRQIQVDCCDSYTDQTVNLGLRNLPMNASIDMTLVSVVDYSKRNRLQGAMFSEEESTRLLATKVCLADLRSRITTWTPQTADPACKKY